MSNVNEAGKENNTAGVAAATQQLRDTAAQVKESVKNLGNQARDAATHGYEQVRQQAGDAYEHGKQKAGEAYEHGKEKARQYEQTLEQYVQEKPIQSLLIAAGVGVVLGILWKRS